MSNYNRWLTFADNWKHLQSASTLSDRVRMYIEAPTCVCGIVSEMCRAAEADVKFDATIAVTTHEGLDAPSSRCIPSLVLGVSTSRVIAARNLVYASCSGGLRVSN
jgi:hypothetical protein